MRLLLLEHDHSLGASLCRHLRSSGHVVDWCTTLRQADGLACEPYDAWLFDSTLPDGCGLEWLKRMRARGLDVPALGLGSHDEVAERIRGLDGGADDFLARPFAPEELCARVRAVVRRVSGGPQRRSVGDVDVDLTARAALRAGAPIDLTAREWSLLEALVLRAGRIVTKTELEALTLGGDGDVASNSIEVYVCKLRNKLGRRLIETVRGLGYRIPACGRAGAAH